MAVLIVLHLLVAAAAPAIMGRLGRRGFLLLALAPGAAALWTMLQAPAVFDPTNPPGPATPPGLGAVREFIPWIGAIQLHFDFRLDALAWTLALIVSGVGTLVLVYCAAYFSQSATALGRFGAVFLGFAGAMFGLVTANNTLLLYTFWELTTVFSFLLIGHYHGRETSRRAAAQAIFVTTFGGLAMLAGIVALGQLPGGSYQLHELVESAAAGRLGRGAPELLLPAAIALLLVGAITKSALVPFHFWLPAAMAAPTPVSAYLHAAAMVKAGVYLVARIAPFAVATPAWRPLTLWLGLATMLLGGYRALRQYDLKLLLAYGTVSQLGMLIAVFGYGTAAAALAGLALLVAHAVFKSALFLTVGVIDSQLGTRDLRELSGVGRAMPTLAVAAGVAAGSMVGVPPLVGFVAKEAALGAFGADWLVLALFTAGAVLTLAYGWRFFWGAFALKSGVDRSVPRYRSRLMQAPIILLAVFSVLPGLAPGLLELVVQPATGGLPGERAHLALWHGFSLPLALTVAVFVLGTGMFVARGRVERAQEALRTLPSADSAYRRSMHLLHGLARAVTSFTQRGSLPAYLSVIIASASLTAVWFVFAAGFRPVTVRWADSWGQVVVAIGALATAYLAARARRRLKAVILAGVSGYAVALLYGMHGAPDLALTQVMAETVTLVLFVLVLRRLPTYFTNRPFTRDRWRRVAVAVAGGASLGLAALIAFSQRVAAPVSLGLPAATLEHGYGRNVVNVILVDTRAWDTMGEISVVLMAATGVASLLFLRDRSAIVDSGRNRLRGRARENVWGEVAGLEVFRSPSPAPSQVRAPHRGQAWLKAGKTLAPVRRSLVFEVGTRMIFYSMMVFSLYLLFAGHNLPGGGFAGGLMAGTALAVRYLAGGRYELGEALPLHAGHLLGSGLVIAAGAAILPVFFGGAALQTVVFDFKLPIFGDVHLASALLFDVGVYVLVIGLVLDVLRSLGAEIDRHGELEGIAEDALEELEGAQ